MNYNRDYSSSCDGYGSRRQDYSGQGGYGWQQDSNNHGGSYGRQRGGGYDAKKPAEEAEMMVKKAVNIVKYLPSIYSLKVVSPVSRREVGTIKW